MKRKLVAVAVAGVLGGPAVAMAQSTVQLYGRMYVEYAYVDQGAHVTAPGQLVNTDVLQTPASHIGFRGEEKLGGGMSAWFQCETTADVRGVSQNGFCGRNSALGLRGGFGNVFIGTWDTPFKRTLGIGNVGSNATGIFGNSFLLTGGSTNVTVVNASRALFARQQANSINYDSPAMNGFRVMMAYSATNDATATTTTVTNSKPRVFSLGGQYAAGPLTLAAGYERHSAFAAAGGSNDDRGYHLAASYRFGSVTVGGIYTQQRFETAAAAENKFRGWHLGVDWRIQGPHGLRAAYTDGDSSGTVGAAAVAGAGATRPAIVAAGGEGAKQYMIRYVHTLSKRTEFTAGYVRIDNDANAAYYLGGMASTVRAGNDSDAWGVAVDHRF